MAQKRMFDKGLLETDAFMDMPMPTKALYFLLGMEADDEGFVSPKRVMRLYGGNEDDLKVLIAKNYVIQFESGVIVITDWKENNYLDKKRIKETKYQNEKKLLALESTKYVLLNKCLTDVKPEEYRGEERRREENGFSDEKPTPSSYEEVYPYGNNKSPRNFANARRAEKGKPPLRTPRTQKQKETFDALKWKDYFRDQGYEMHGMQFFKVHNEKREKVVSKLIISAYGTLKEDIKELIDWWFTGEGYWAEYEPEQCFATRTLERFVNRGKGKKETKDYMPII